MEMIRRAGKLPKKLGILSGTFHPPTKAHFALANAALGEVDEVLFVLPRALPHKRYEDVGFEDRLRLLSAAVDDAPSFSIGVSKGGLFVEIAGECRAVYGSGVELFFLCGRDAAERIVNWDYGRPGAIEEMLREFGLLVAPRHGPYVPPSELGGSIRTLAVAPEFDELSATTIRERIGRGEIWEDLVPESIVDLVRQIYCAKAR